MKNPSLRPANFWQQFFGKLIHVSGHVSMESPAGQFKKSLSSTYTIFIRDASSLQSLKSWIIHSQFFFFIFFTITICLHCKCHHFCLINSKHLTGFIRAHHKIRWTCAMINSIKLFILFWFIFFHIFCIWVFTVSIFEI